MENSSLLLLLLLPMLVVVVMVEKNPKNENVNFPLMPLSTKSVQ